VQVTKSSANGVITSDIQKKFAVKSLPKQLNAAVKHDAAGVLGMSAPNAFYLTLKPAPSLDKKYPAVGKVIAGADALAQMKKGDAVRSIRITRVGQAAQSFKTDDESFKKLLEAATGKKKTTTP
jgi:cyclophilin family peptidyl-prolyl cis-trans isomerase